MTLPNPPTRQRPWVARHKMLTSALGFILVLLVIGTIGIIVDPQPATKATATPAATATAKTGSPAGSVTVATTTVAPVPKVRSVTYRGTGDQILKIQKPSEGPVVAEVSYSGDGNFVVNTPDDALLLVNSIGSYQGTVLLDAGSSTGETTRLKVTASGPWTITLSELAAVRTWRGQTSGKHDDVIMYTGKSGIITLTYTGSGNFVVQTYAGDPFADLMVNDVGTYNAQKTINEGPVLLQVTASGTWTMKVKEDG